MGQREFPMRANPNRSVIGVAVLVSVLAPGAPNAADKGFPDRPVRLIVPYPPGGGSDVVARLLAPKMSEALGQPVVIDNPPGAATIIGLDTLAKRSRTATRWASARARWRSIRR